jgi:hypothetical protein
MLVNPSKSTDHTSRIKHTNFTYLTYCTYSNDLFNFATPIDPTNFTDPIDPTYNPDLTDPANPGVGVA